ncbi:hypothetical protein [Mesorhizobium sp. CAU 1732]|uniref:hypothetical protein n=1 Tax=Mesorhizobium sp. CAU 1732 TaxID=3140358 RepID=UPI00326085DD
MRFQSWPDIGFWPYTIIVFFSVLFLLGFAAEAWLGIRIDQIGKRQAADPAIRPRMVVDVDFSIHRGIHRSARLLAEPERSWAVLWADRFKRYFLSLAAIVGIGLSGLVITALLGWNGT